MLKEIKYFIFVATVFGFLFFSINYYFSDKNKKNFFRAFNIYDNKIDNLSKNLEILESDTENIVKYNEDTSKKNEKKYKFWELIFED